MRLILDNYKNKEINGYKISILKMSISVCLIIASFGALGLLFYWRKDWLLLCTCNKCELSCAEKVLLKVNKLIH